MTVRVVNATTGAVLAETAGVARRWRDRLRGLLGTDRLPLGGGLVLVPCRQVHGRGMRYPLIAVYCAADGTVLRVARVEPGARGPWVWRARAVVELAADPLPAVRVGEVVTWTTR